MAVNYFNIVHLAVIIEGQLGHDRPAAAIVPTSNPGYEGEHYIGLVLRVYKDKTDLNSICGYVTFRFNEVKWKSKKSHLPKFSSIEIRKPDFSPYTPPVKIHFDPDKVKQEDYTRWYDASNYAEAENKKKPMTYEEKQRVFLNDIGSNSLMLVYQRILDLIDGKM